MDARRLEILLTFLDSGNEHAGLETRKVFEVPQERAEPRAPQLSLTG